MVTFMHTDRMNEPSNNTWFKNKSYLKSVLPASARVTFQPLRRPEYSRDTQKDRHIYINIHNI